MSLVKDNVTCQVELPQDEFYSLMVEDDIYRGIRFGLSRADRPDDISNTDTGFVDVGLLRTSEGKIYLSKYFHKINNQLRGKVVQVKVTVPLKNFILIG